MRFERGRTPLWLCLAVLLTVRPQAPANAASPLTAAPTSTATSGVSFMAAESRFRPGAGTGAITGEYIVVLQDVPADKVKAIVRQLSEKYGVTAQDVWTRALKGFWGTMPEATAKAMSDDPRVRYVEQNARMVSTSGTQKTDAPAPLDRNGAMAVVPDFKYPLDFGTHPLWHLWRLSHRDRDSGSLNYTYDSTSTGEGVQIFVVDTGVVRFHREFIDASNDASTNADHGNPTQHRQVKELDGSNVTNQRYWASSAPFNACGGQTLQMAIDDKAGETIPYRSAIWWPLDNFSHGTAVGSIAGGRSVGVAKKAEIVPVKTDECGSDSSTAYFVRAFEWILRKAGETTPRRPAVVTMSTYRTLAECEDWEGSRAQWTQGLCKAGSVTRYIGFLSAFEEAVQAVLDDGIPVVASANNNGRDACHDTPARLSRSGGIGGLGHGAGGVITVGGLAKGGDWRYLLLPSEMVPPSTDDQPADASNWGPCVDLWAPAERIPGALSEGWSKYRDKANSGTSFSAPMVAGLIARMFSEDSALRNDLQSTTARRGVPEKVWNRLRDAATPFGLDALYGAGAGLERDDSRLRLLVQTQPTTAAVLAATSRRIAYMGAFSLQEQPASVVRTAGQTLRAVPVGTGLYTTEWFSLTASGTSESVPELANGTSADHSLCIQDVPECVWPTTNTRYWARLTRGMEGQIPLSADSATATVVVDAPMITQQPKNTWVRVGANVTLEVTALVPGGTATYQWSTGQPGHGTAIAGATTPSYTFNVGTSPVIRSYFVSVSAGGRTVDSEVALVRVEGTCPPPPALGPAVVDPPYGSTPAPGKLVTVTLPATGEGLEYRWYAGPKGVTSQRLKSPAGYPLFGSEIQFEAGPTQIFARVYSGDGCAYTDSDTIVVPPLCSMTIDWSQTAAAILPRFGSRVISVHPTSVSGQYTYRWFTENAGQRTELVGLNTPDIDVPYVATAIAAPTYRVLVTDGSCSRLSDPMKVEQVSAASDCTARIDYSAPIVFGNGPHLITIPFARALEADTGYVWLPGGSDLAVPEPGAACNQCDRAERVFTPQESLRLRLKGQCYSGLYESVEDSPLIRLQVVPCGTSGFSLTSSPSSITAGTPFKLHAPSVANGTYRWYSGSPAQLIGTTTQPVLAFADGINATTSYFVTVQDPICNGTPVTSQTLTLFPCGHPRQRSVRKTTALPPGAGSVVVPAGTIVALSVDDDHDGVTFEWFRGASYSDTSNPVGTSATVNIVAPGGTTKYWVRLTRSCNNAPLTTNTGFFSVTGTCTPSIVVQPVPVTAIMPVMPGVTVDLTASVVASGQAPITYEWYDVAAPGVTLGNSASYTWTYHHETGAPAAAQRNVAVRVTACNQSATSQTVQLSVVQVPQKILAYGGGGAVYPTGHATLTVRMDPPPSDPQHTYHYAWYRDNGTAEGEQLLPDMEDVNVPTSLASYWVKVTGTHQIDGGAAYTEVSVSPRMHVWPYGTCELPAVSVTQSATNAPDPTTPVIFTAICDWDNVTFQWYEGQRGDTRVPHPSDPYHNERVTITGALPTAVWVRASLECGAFQDSDTMTFTRGPCVPILINQSVPSTEVAYGGTAYLYVDPVPNASYTWYKGEPGIAISGQYQPTLTLPNVTASGRYHVKVTNTDPACTTTAESFVATVRVASCGSVVPPAWQTEIWTNYGVPATLSAQAQGGTGYQWYRGEVGDASSPLSGETLASYTTTALTADAKYWARIFGASCIVDSPTMTVRVCVPPQRAAVGQTLHLNVVRNQTITWNISAIGTDLTYQWFKGAVNDESHPIGLSIDKLRVTPSETTQYWAKVTGRCGTYTSDPYIANVCPDPAQPVAAASLIMPGTTTTLSVAATGTGLTYQWFIGSWDDISHPIAGATTPTITTPTLTAATSFWCQVTSGTCSRNSAPVTVSVCETRQLTWNYNAKVKVEKNESQVISVQLTGSEPADLTFYLGETAGDVAHSTAIPVVTNAYQVHSDVTKTYWARATVSGTVCYTDSLPLRIEVCVPKITTQPQSVLLDKTNPAATTTLTAAADIAPVTWQWYTGASGDTSSPIAGQISATLVVSPASDTLYWVRVQSSCDRSKDSDAATVTVCNPPAIAAVYNPGPIQSGSSAFVSVSATGSDLTWQWYRGVSGDTANPLAGTTAGFTVSPTTTTSYWCRVSSHGVCWTASGTITVNVCSPPVITTQPQSPPRAFTGTPVTISVSATPAASTYQWYIGVSGDQASPVSGATAASLSVAPTAETSYWVRVTNSICTTDSAAATVTLCSYEPVITLPATRSIAYGESTTLPFPWLYPLNESKAITWYRGASGVRTTPVRYTLSASGLDYTTPALTASTSYWMEFEHNGCLSVSTATMVTVCKPTISASPVGTTIAAGSAATLSVTTTPIAGQTFQWYAGTAGTTTSPVAGATTASLTVSPTVTTSYWVRVKGTCVPDVFADSAAATVIVCNPPAISSVSPTQFTSSGQQTAVMVTASGSNLTYQWYIGTSGTTTSPIAGATSPLRYVSPTTTTSYWCRVTADGVCVTNSSTIIVDVCTSPSITTQPAPTSIFSGGTATLSVVASSPRPMTYQWYRGPSGDPSLIVAGANASTLTVSPTADTSYWCRVTASVCTVDSAAATVSMCVYAPVVNATVATQSVYSGDRVTLTLPAMSPVLEKTITWYQGASGVTTTPVLTATGTTLNYLTPPLIANAQYWAEFTNNSCVSRTTTYTVNVCKPAITAHPQSSTILSGAQASLSAAATGSPLTWQWYIGSSGNTAQPIAGATASTYAPTPSATTTYWVRVTGCSFTADSAAATVTVCTTPAVTNLTRTTNYAIGGTGSVTVTATGANLTYQWYKGQSGDTTQPIANATAATYSFTLQNTAYYWVRVGTTCSSASANSAAIIYNVAAHVVAYPADVTIPRGTSTTLTVSATGTYLTYQWFNGNGSTVAGATSSTFTTPALSVNTLYSVNVGSGTLAGPNGPQTTITMCDGPSIVGFTNTTGAYYTFTVNVAVNDRPNARYFWYRGTPGNTAQSTSLGELTAVQSFSSTTEKGTYWVRVFWTDLNCYTDTIGRTIP
jgi:Ig-like domain CHU_C associated